MIILTGIVTLMTALEVLNNGIMLLMLGLLEAINTMGKKVLGTLHL